MEKKKGLHHVAMNVSDIDASIRFYTDALGCSLLRRWGDEPRGAMLDMGDGAILEMFERPAATHGEGTLLHIALRAEDVDAAYQTALNVGAQEQTTPRDIDLEAEEPYPIRMAFVKGPDGEPIELFCER